jgi:hypothetical protein
VSLIDGYKSYKSTPDRYATSDEVEFVCPGSRTAPPLWLLPVAAARSLYSHLAPEIRTHTVPILRPTCCFFNGDIRDKSFAERQLLFFNIFDLKSDLLYLHLNFESLCRVRLSESDFRKLHGAEPFVGKLSCPGGHEIRYAGGSLPCSQKRANGLLFWDCLIQYFPSISSEICCSCHDNWTDLPVILPSYPVLMLTPNDRGNVR